METLSELTENIQKELCHFIQNLSNGMEKRLARNFKDSVLGLIEAKVLRLTEVSRIGARCSRLIHDVKRTHRFLKNETWIKEDVEEKRIRWARCYIKKGTPIAVDLSHIEKPYAKKMEHIAKVWNGKEKCDGYWWLQAAGVQRKRRIVPLKSLIFSQREDNFLSTNRTEEEFLEDLSQVLEGKGIFTFDRGFDRRSLVKKLFSLNLKFVQRIRSHRDVEVKKQLEAGINQEGTVHLEDLLKEASPQGRVVKRIRKKELLLWVGFCQIKLPDLPYSLYLVWTKGGGLQEFILLTNLRVGKLSDALRILKLYSYRWQIEELFREMKEDLGVEKVILRTLDRINKFLEIAMVAYSFVFILLNKGGRVLHFLLELGGRLGLKQKKEDTFGRTLKGLSHLFAGYIPSLRDAET